MSKHTASRQLTRPRASGLALDRLRIPTDARGVHASSPFCFFNFFIFKMFLRRKLWGVSIHQLTTGIMIDYEFDRPFCVDKLGFQGFMRNRNHRVIIVLFLDCCNEIISLSKSGRGSRVYLCVL